MSETTKDRIGKVWKVIVDITKIVLLALGVDVLG